MGAKWLVGVAMAAWVFTGSLAPNDRDAQSLWTIVSAGLCGPNASQAQRASLNAALEGAAAYAQTLPGSLDSPPPLMPGLGDAHFAVTTSNPQAQAYFDQGLRFLYGFNHFEAERAFRQAQRLDPNCAMCLWGESIAYGPNINAPMEATDVARAYESSRQAFAKRSNATPVEQALIEALQTRYAQHPPENRAALDAAFADAMGAAANRFPDNDTVQIVAAESAMDTQPWDYWDANGRDPKGRAGDAIHRIETVLARSPDNEGANHLYIHLAEASTDPWRAESAAERLSTETTTAGHLVHMPGHIFYRVGRFRDSIRVNLQAVTADETYIHAFNPSPIYQYGYYPHNLHFVMTSAAMGGDSRTTLQFADKLDSSIPIEMAQNVVLAQPVKAAPWLARAQFATPESILASSAPPEGVSFVTGAWHYARGVAQVRLGHVADARTEAQAIADIVTHGDFSAMHGQNIPGEDILSLYSHLLLGRAFMSEHNYPHAIAELTAAADAQSRIPYTEPPYIYYPVRRTLGAAYLLNNQPAVAEMQFLQVLIESPNDAYAYWGLAESRRQRHDSRGASAAMSLFRNAWLGNSSNVTVWNL